MSRKRPESRHAKPFIRAHVSEMPSTHRQEVRERSVEIGKFVGMHRNSTCQPKLDAMREPEIGPLDDAFVFGNIDDVDAYTAQPARANVSIPPLNIIVHYRDAAALSA